MMKKLILILILFISLISYSQNIIDDITYKIENGNIYIRNDSVITDFDNIKFEIYNWKEILLVREKTIVETFTSINGSELKIFKCDGYIEKIHLTYNGYLYEFVIVRISD